MAKLHSSRATSVVFWVLSCIAILPTLANAFVIRPIAIGLIATVAAITLYCVLLALLRPRIALLVYGLFLVVVFPFDLVSIIGSGEPISYGLLNSIANTSLSETLPQIKPYTAHIAILLLAFVGYFFLLFRYIPRSYRLPKPAIYLSPIAALCVTLVLTLIVAHAHLRSGNYPQKLTGKTSSETARRIAQHTIDEAYLYVSPIRELRLAARFRKDQRRMAKSLSTRPPFPDTLFHRLPNFDTTIIGVLSIGETSRACNWQLAGYPRHTNPRLSKRSNLYFFADTYSGGTFTDVAAPMMYSNDSPQAIRTWEHAPILNEIFRANGLATAPTSMQGSDLKWSTDKYVLTTGSCDTAWVYLSFTYEPTPPDITLIPHATAMFETLGRPLFLTFWGYGGHAVYQDCYEARDAHFTPDDAVSKEGNINAFDNTIVHTDRVHDSLISILEAMGKPAFLVYAADHGEILYDIGDNLLFHSTKHFAHGEAHVPCFVWLSNEYIAKYPRIADALAANLAKPIQTPSIFHTVQHLMHAVGPDFDSTQSLASFSYRPPEKREGLNSNYAITPEPSYSAAERARIDSTMATLIRRHAKSE